MIRNNSSMLNCKNTPKVKKMKSGIVISQITYWIYKLLNRLLVGLDRLDFIFILN